MLGRGCLAVFSMIALGGCSFAARSPAMYRDDTAKVLATKSQEIRACYDSVLATHADARGVVAVRFDVETEHGRITNVTIDDAQTTAPPEVASCVTGAISGLVLTPVDKRLGKATWAWSFSTPQRSALLEGRQTHAD